MDRCTRTSHGVKETLVSIFTVTLATWIGFIVQVLTRVALTGIAGVLLPLYQCATGEWVRTLDFQQNGRGFLEML